MSDPETKIHLDAKDLGIKNEIIKSSLEPFFKEAQEKSEVFVNNDIILNKISENIKAIVNNLNNELKDIPALENNIKIIELNSLKVRMNGNDIKTLIDLIDTKKQNSLSTENNDFDYNLQLNLDFKINIANKENSYNYNPKSAFITSNKKDLYNKTIILANKLSQKLANQELNGKNIIDNVLNGKFADYQQSFSNELNNILKDKNIKIEKSKNMVIDRKELSFQLKNLLDSKKNIDYFNKFAKFIKEAESPITTIEKMFIEKESEFYQFKEYENSIDGDKIFTKNFSKFTVTRWSIEGIELPERDLGNIKIYHKILEIKNSWENFYWILKTYLDLEQKNIERVLNYNIEFSYRIFSNYQEFKNQDKEKRLYQWSNNITKQINKMYLDNFLLDINTSNKDWPATNPENYKGVEIPAVSINLFSNQLTLFLIEKYNVYYYFRK